MHPYPPRPLGHRRTALALLVSAAGSLALADAGRDIEQTLVTATRTEQPLHEVMAPVTVITREDIERIQPLDVMELLEQAPGASLSRTGGYGAATSLMLRGNSSGHTLVMVDGVRINSATLGGASLTHINPALIERIEIVRGPRSSLYGSDAIGGVVNIITRRPQGEFQPRLQAGIGNHGIRQSEVFIGGGDERLSAGLTASHFYTTGIDHTTHKDLGRGDDDAFRETSLGLTLDHRPTDWLQAGLNYQYNRGRSEYDSSMCSALACSHYNLARIETLSGQLVLTPLAGWDSTLRLGRATDELENRVDNLDTHQTSSQGEFKTRRTQYSWQNDFSMIEGQVLTLGYDFEREEISSDTAYDRDKRLNRAWFGQLQSQWTPVLDTVVGYRKDDNGQFGNYETANAALGIQLPADFRLIASYSEGFKAPTFNDLYYPSDPFFQNNPDLVPETSKNHELELRGQHFGVHWSLNAFHNKVKRLIQFNPDPAINGPDQIDAARLRGAELSADTELAGWQLGVSATYLQPRDTRTGNDLQLRPRRFATLNADRQFGDLQLGLGLRVESSRYGDPANSYRLPGYGKANLRLGYAVNEEWQLKLKLDNLLDKKIKLAGDFTPGHYYRQPGLEAIVSVVYTPR